MIWACIASFLLGAVIHGLTNAAGGWRKDWSNLLAEIVGWLLILVPIGKLLSFIVGWP